MNATLTGKLMTTRKGTMAVGIGAAVLAAFLLLMYLNSYRNSVQGGATTTSVLVAKNLIPKGTSGTLIGQQQLFQVTSISRDNVKDGALLDPQAIAGRTAVADIFPGQQLTAADFTAVASDALPSRLTGDERAVAVPIDAAHGMLGHLQEGDRVDIYVGLNVEQTGVTKPILKLLLPNIEVLSVPPPDAGGGNVVLNLKGLEAPRVAFASEQGRLWFVLRPQSGAEPTRPSTTTVDSLLLGLKPVQGG